MSCNFWPRNGVFSHNHIAHINLFNEIKFTHSRGRTLRCENTYRQNCAPDDVEMKEIKEYSILITILIIK